MNLHNQRKGNGCYKTVMVKHAWSHIIYMPTNKKDNVVKKHNIILASFVPLQS